MQGKKGARTAKSSAQKPTAAQDAGTSGTGEGGSNWLSRWRQKQDIRQSYYAAARSGTAAQTAGGKACLLYTSNADTIVGNMDSQIFLGGSEPTTLKDLSEMLGKETIDALDVYKRQTHDRVKKSAVFFYTHFQKRRS